MQETPWERAVRIWKNISKLTVDTNRCCISNLCSWLCNILSNHISLLWWRLRETVLYGNLLRHVHFLNLQWSYIHACIFKVLVRNWYECCRSRWSSCWTNVTWFLPGLFVPGCGTCRENIPLLHFTPLSLVHLDEGTSYLYCDRYTSSFIGFLTRTF